MKLRLSIALALVIVSVAVAGPRYLVIAMRADAPAADRLAVRDKIKSLPPYDWGQIDNWEKLTRWREAANTNRVWVLRCIDAEKPGSRWQKFPWTKEQFEEWKDAHLTEPNKLQVRASDTPEQTLRDAGLEPVPPENPVP